MINNGPFKSKQVFADYINLSWNTVNEYINSLKPDSKKGIYYFDSPITKEQEDSILNNPKYLKPKNQEVFLYNSWTMELINGKPFEFTKDVVKFLDMDKSNFYRRKLDTNKPFEVKGVSYLAFRTELSSKSISDFLNNNIVK